MFDKNYIDYLIQLNGELDEMNAELQEHINETKKGTKIYSSDLLFLASLFSYFGTHSHGDVTLDGNTVHLDLFFYDKNLVLHEIKSDFDINICSKYYNRISKFVDEVL